MQRLYTYPDMDLNRVAGLRSSAYCTA